MSPAQPSFLERLLPWSRPSAAVTAATRVVQELAGKRGHGRATEVHALAWLLEEVTVVEVLRGMGKDVARLKQDVERFLSRTGAVYGAPGSQGAWLETHVREALQAAETVGQQRRLRAEYPVAVLLVLLSSCHPVWMLLLDHGITLVDLERQISHGDLGENGGLPLPRLDVPEAERVADLVMLNDEFTDMEFVLRVMRLLVGLPAPEAMKKVMEVHDQRLARLGTYFLPDAQAKLEAVNEYARCHGRPLRCVLTRPV